MAERGVKQSAQPQFVQREFRGVNLADAREAIGENEFYWLEDIIPIANGNLSPVPSASAVLATIAETGSPSFTYAFNTNGLVTGTPLPAGDYVFAVWQNSGNGWIVKVDGTFSQKIFTAQLASGQTDAAQWNNQGILIVDAIAGYFEYNISAGQNLIVISGTVQSVTLLDGGNGYTAVPSITTPAPNNASIIALMGINAGTVITAAGTGYIVGDVLTFAGVTSGIPGTTTPATLTVTAVGGGGAITGLAILNQGQGNAITVGAQALNGGHGTGATATGNFSVTKLLISTGGGGSGYVVSSFALTFTGGTPNIVATGTGSALAGFVGTQIEVYAGRAWVADKRTVSFTDAATFNSFVGSGSSFTINDSYLHSVITCLFAANNYLYIFGDDSIDVLSNVTVSQGVASFSRINISASIGTTLPTSVFAYGRSIAFANQTGFYLLSGATPEKASDKIARFLQQIDFTLPIYGAQLTVRNELCAAFLVNVNDVFARGINESIAPTPVPPPAPPVTVLNWPSDGVTALTTIYGTHDINPGLGPAPPASSLRILNTGGTDSAHTYITALPSNIAVCTITAKSGLTVANPLAQGLFARASLQATPVVEHNGYRFDTAFSGQLRLFRFDLGVPTHIGNSPINLAALSPTYDYYISTGHTDVTMHMVCAANGSIEAWLSAPGQPDTPHLIASGAATTAYPSGLLGLVSFGNPGGGVGAYNYWSNLNVTYTPP